MLRLGLETSARPARVAIHSPRAGCIEAVLDDRQAHASDLLPALDRLLAQLGARPSEIEVVFVGTGPGSYTGLRVGVATALGLARGAGAALFALPSIEVAAYAALEVGATADVLLDARGGMLYHACYRRVEDEIETLRAPAVVSPSQVATILSREGALLANSAAIEAAQLTPGARERVVSAPLASASALLELGLRRIRGSGAMPPEAIMPLYLRPFEAKPRRR